MNENKFSDLLSTELEKLNITNKRNFKVPTHRSQKYLCDFYISSPLRAIIEMKFVSVDSSKNKNRKIKRYAIEQLQLLQAKFKPTPLAILISNHKYFEENKEDISTIKIKNFSREEAFNCANEIKDLINHNLSKKQRIFSPKKIDDGYFSDVLVSLGLIIDKQRFAKLVDEIGLLEMEIRHRHFTAAALRVGRTLEYMIYVCAKSWGVKVNNRTNEKISSLDKSFEMLKADYINYSYSESNEKEQSKKRLQKAIKNITSKIQDISFDLDEEIILQRTNTPLNIQTLIRDIKKKYSVHEDVRNEIDEILTDGKLTEIIKLRNSAAHAKSSLLNHEVTKQEIETMQENLRYILFKLVNIETLIHRLSLN